LPCSRSLLPCNRSLLLCVGGRQWHGSGLSSMIHVYMYICTYVYMYICIYSDGKRVLEIGSGMGLSGMAAACLPLRPKVHILFSIQYSSSKVHIL